MIPYKIKKNLTVNLLQHKLKTGEQLVSMMPGIKKDFSFLGDDIIELSTENDALKNKMGSCDGEWSEEAKNKMLKQIDDEKKANLFMIRM